MTMTDKVHEDILAIRASGRCNMLSIHEVFQIAMEQDMLDLAEYLFYETRNYSKFILTGERD